MDLVDHVVVGPRELDAEVGPDGRLRGSAASAAAALLLVAVVGHGEGVEVEDESAVSLSSTKSS